MIENPRAAISFACALIALLSACGDEPAPASTEELGDAGFVGPSADGGNADGGSAAHPSDGGGDAGDGGGTLAMTTSASLFGMVWNGLANKPTFPVGVMRLWDVGAGWDVLNPSPGNYVWTALDNRLNQAHAMNVEVLYTIGRVPQFISSDPSLPCETGPGNCAPPTDLASGDAAFKAFVTQLVLHSLSSPTHITYYNLWNEPDNAIFWSGTIPQLVTMCKDAAAIIRALDPNAVIVSPSPTGYKPYNWLMKYYAAGGQPAQDVMSFHTASTIAATLTNLDMTRAVMAANGDATKPFSVTEGSWGTVQNGTLADDDKVAFVAQEYLHFWMQGITQYDWYASDNPTLGTLESGGTLKPAAVAYAQIYSWLVGSTHLANPCTHAADETWTCSLDIASGPAQIVWNPITTKSISAVGFAHYQKLDGPTIHPVAASSATIGKQPILLTH